MTLGYSDPKPGTFCSAATLARKWSHSILEEESFLSEWGARESARNLELEVEIANIPAITPLFKSSSYFTAKRNTRSERRQHVGFADSVQVYIGLADEITMFPTRVPQDLIGTGCMPWHLAYVLNPPWSDPQATLESALIPSDALTPVPFFQSRLPTDAQVDAPQHEHDIPIGAINFPPDANVAVPVLPNFARHILTGDRTAVDDDWDRGMTLRTWFLHHEQQQHCELPRLIQLVGNAHSWRNQLIALWIDLVWQGERIEIHVAEPDPPRPQHFAHVAYDILIVQGDSDLRKAGLVTAMSATEAIPILGSGSAPSPSSQWIATCQCRTHGRCLPAESMPCVLSLDGNSHQYATTACHGQWTSVCPSFSSYSNSCKL